METDNIIAVSEQSRIKNIDWRQVIVEIDKLDAETTFYVGIMDQSTRTHIKKGRIAYIDPRKYNVWTESVDGSRSRARLYISKRANTQQIKVD